MTRDYSQHFADMRGIYTESVAPNDIRGMRIAEQRKVYKEYKDNKLDPVGQEDSDIDNDGQKGTKRDKYLLNRRNTRGVAINKRLEKESVEFYDWRSSVSEDVQNVIDDMEKPVIDIKPVNNYAKGKKGNPVVKINPTINIKEDLTTMDQEVVSLLEDLDYINIAIECATDYFYEEGINADGVNIIAEKLGLEEFAKFVFDITDEYMLDEARAAKKARNPKTVEQVKAEIAAREAKKSAKPKKASTQIKREVVVSTAKKQQPQTKTLPPGQQRIVDATKGAVKRATSPEGKKEIAKNVAGTLRGAADAAARLGLSAWEGHKAAMKQKEKGASVGSQLGRGAGAAVGAFFKKGTSQFREWVEGLVNEGYDIADWSLNELYEEYSELQEKATSEQQQKLFGLALSVKRGQTPRSEASPEVIKMVDGMSQKQLRDFAKTSHKGLPKRVPVNESVTFDDLLRFMK
jgi:hypothetical protein